MADIIGTNLNNTLTDEQTFGIPGFRRDKIAGLEGHDTILITDGNDTVFGGSGNDTITDGRHPLFGSGDDNINGDGGNDTIIAGEGRDTIDGGADFDTVDYSASTAAVAINLSTFTLPQVGGLAEGDILIVRSMGGQTQFIPRARIKSRGKLPHSLMLSATQLGMTPQEVADVVAYLRTSSAPSGKPTAQR